MLHAGLLTHPEDRVKAARVMAYAEATGGDTLTYARVRWSYYWGPAELVSPLDAARVTGVSEEREAEILATVLHVAKGGSGPAPSVAQC